MRTDDGRKTNKFHTSGGKILFSYSLFIKVAAQTASSTSMCVFISAQQSDFSVPENLNFTRSWAGQPSEEVPIVLMV